jgi:hypothetical protein
MAAEEVPLETDKLADFLRIVEDSAARRKTIKGELQEQLDHVGINRATLFPDLGSAARYLAWAVHKSKRPYVR